MCIVQCQAVSGQTAISPLISLAAHFLRESAGVIKHLVDAPALGIGSSVIENAKQVPTASRG
jgi:hypothetical protein